MIVDSSAIVAILRREAEGPAFTDVLLNERGARISAANFLEVSMVVEYDRDPVVGARLDAFYGTMNITVEPISVRQAHLARAAYRDFGRGSGHPARLNFGDCFAYALAKDKREPLLFKGNDFLHTDVEPATSRPRP